MAGEKFIKHSGNGSLVETVATQIGGGGAADKIPALNASGQLDVTMMPTGIGADTVVVPASEDVAAGDMINLWNDGGTAKARKADATTAGKPANGFTQAAVTSGNNVTVYREGNNTGATGMTVGPQYLSTTAGLTTATAPSTSGNMVQEVGFATTATNMNFEANKPIELA